MKTKALFYHAGCPICVSAEQKLVGSLDASKFDIEVIHLGEDKARVAEAERVGVKSVPALIIDGEVLHINFGADIAALR
ncbi:MAG: thioredoxin family protein [Blastocatellia bacterium]|nr:thioredoxin family protein [Blastocatellia bacterium]